MDVTRKGANPERCGGGPRSPKRWWWTSFAGDALPQSHWYV